MTERSWTQEMLERRVAQVGELATSSGVERSQGSDLPVIGSMRRARDEAGAVLLLALIFMVIVALMVTGLLAWSGNDLKQIAAFNREHAQTYAVDGAMNIAIESVRYSSTGCPTRSAGSSKAGLSIFVSSSNATNRVNVWCYTVSQPWSKDSRIVTLWACPAVSSTANLGNCTMSAPTGISHPYLTVQVTFDDYSGPTLALNACQGACGTTMSINSWTFSSATTS